MTLRLRRAVPALLALAAASGVYTADEIVLRSPGHNLRAVVASDELLIERTVPVIRGRRQARMEVAGAARADTQTLAKNLLAAGTASRVDPVVYLDGAVGNPSARAIATRRILLEAAPGQNPATLASEHGLRLAKAVKGQPGWWIAEPLDSGVFAALDAARSLGRDARASLVWPMLEMPVEIRYTPNDPIFTAGFQWHLYDNFPGIRIREVWDTWKGEGTNLAISDTGMEVAHPDLKENVRLAFGYDYATPSTDPNPKSASENHATAVAGVAAARGDNALGVTGVAFLSGIIPSRVLNNYDPNSLAPRSLATDEQLYDAMSVQYSSINPLDLCWANNNSWGPSATSPLASCIPGPLTLKGMENATTNGRGGRGIVIVFSAGNDGTLNPNEAQDCSAFDGYLNRFVIGVGALAPPSLAAPALAGMKASYSETGPNLTISAPGGTGGIGGIGIVTTDRTGDAGYVPGDYVPPQFNLAGTSFSAPIVTGCATLMQQARTDLSWRDVRQIMMHRGQDVRPPGRLAVGPIFAPHDPWAAWRANGTNLAYNNWYGFGAVDMGRFVFGGGGASGDQATTGGRDEPGALRWPLLPPLLTQPLTYEASFAIPAPGQTVDPYAVYDAPMLYYGPTGGEMNWFALDLVADGRQFEGDGRTRVCNVTMPIAMTEGIAADSFRVDTVEVTVRLDDIGTTSYNAGMLVRAPNGGFSYGDYAFYLTSPNGTTCILGRKRPGDLIKESESFKWTFPEVFHTNETNVAGNWTLSIIDEVNSLPNNSALDPADSNPPQCRVGHVALNIYGHQVYPVPGLTRVGSPALASDEDNKAVELSGSGFSRSQGGVSVTQAYWDPDGPNVGVSPVEIPTKVFGTDKLSVSFPAGLLPTASPGQGYLTLANPAIVVGRSAADLHPSVLDTFDSPNVLLPSDTLAGLPTDRHMKRCPPGDAKLVKYSRRPTLTEIPDIQLSSGGTLTLSTDANDADVEAGLPLADPERLTVTVTSLHPYFIAPGNITVAAPPAPGNGTYTISAKTSNDSGFALIQVSVTDGVLTTTKHFRVVVPTDQTGSGCGGGMGLALLGVPLAAWLIRRRRRQS